jgi:hypothetical protein
MVNEWEAAFIWPTASWQYTFENKTAEKGVRQGQLRSEHLRFFTIFTKFTEEDASG